MTAEHPIVAFLRARYDEEEQTANAAIEGPWIQPAHTPTEVRTYDGGGTIAAHVLPRNAAHIALQDPDRVLRAVAAKRRTIERHQPRSLDRWVMCSNCRPVDPDYPSDLTSVVWPCPDLRDLAAPFSDHPEYAALGI